MALLDQPVLLAGANDNARVLAARSRRRFDCKVLPCCLPLLDPASEALARGPMTELAHTLPGYLLPRLAREIPNRAAKTVISAGLAPP